ncbi:MAG: diaminopimelate epimerase [Dehalococcoidia bacterium]|nr:diaminopimelate epimerase [Chloroflexota bacterium]MCK4222531.1 diaminopimelate epimerase [Dehalococcoidia bacterium]MCK4262436.1 diaminopimelate epimerase [Dehalococcoidia bacterium]
MQFSKLHGTGNDFIVVDARDKERDWSALARVMCRRRFGVGADGLILVQDSKVANLGMRMFNPDGSEAEACGNGLRCFVKHAIERRMVARSALTVETLSGVRNAVARVSEGEVAHVEISMGLPRFQPELIPIETATDEIPILDYPLDVGDEKLALCLLSMGNPHAVSFQFEPVAGFPLNRVGPLVENHSLFPQRTNFEVARTLSRGRVEARVWERGVGETLACGSGACAIAVAGHLLGYVDKEVDIMLPGGVLTVSWDGVGELVLGGSVEEVFTGQYLD